MQTRGAVIRQAPGKFEVVDLEVDDPRDNEVQVKMVASGMCHSDEHLVTGDLPFALPIIGGHEGAGIIEEVGPGVAGLQPGDRVVCGFVPSCGMCPMCSTGHQSLCDLGAFLATGRQISDQTARHHAQGQDCGLMCLLGTFGRHTVVNQASCIKVLEDTPLDKACLVGCGVTTGWGASAYVADVAPGDIVVVIGIGGVGASAVHGAAMAGARYVIAVDPIEFKREQAEQFGATHTAASMDEAQVLVQDLSWGRGADKTILTVGVAKGDMIAPMMAMTSKGGTAVVMAVTNPFEMDVQLNLADLTLQQKTLKGAIFGGGNPRHDIPKLLNLYRDGLLKLDEMVTNTYKLEDINQMRADMLDGKNIRGVILFE